MGRRCLPRGPDDDQRRRRGQDMGLLEVKRPGFHFGSLFGFCRAIVFLIIGGRGQITCGSHGQSKTLHICSSQILSLSWPRQVELTLQLPFGVPPHWGTKSSAVQMFISLCLPERQYCVMVKIEDSGLRMPGFGSWLHHPWLCDPGHVFSPL